MHRTMDQPGSHYGLNPGGAFFLNKNVIPPSLPYAKSAIFCHHKPYGNHHHSHTFYMHSIAIYGKVLHFVVYIQVVLGS